jgi:transcriptional regulator with XRE-family HTH domain
MPRLGPTAPPPGPLAGSLKDLGSIVRTQRRASGLRIDDAAALCGVSVDLLSRLENGRSGVSTDRVIKVLDALGLTMLVLDKANVSKVLAAVSAPGDTNGR